MPLAQKKKTLYSEVKPLLHSDGGKGEKISVRLLLPFPSSFSADRCATQALPPTPVPPPSLPFQVLNRVFPAHLQPGGEEGGEEERESTNGREI